MRNTHPVFFVNLEGGSIQGSRWRSRHSRHVLLSDAKFVVYFFWCWSKSCWWRNLHKHWLGYDFSDSFWFLILQKSSVNRTVQFSRMGERVSRMVMNSKDPASAPWFYTLRGNKSPSLCDRHNHLETMAFLYRTPIITLTVTGNTSSLHYVTY